MTKQLLLLSLLIVLAGRTQIYAQTPTTLPAATSAAAQDTADNGEGRSTWFSDARGPTCWAEPLCGPPGRFWIGADYLLWWTRSSGLPPLLTTSPAGTPQAQAGVLGLPSTSVLFGDTGVNDRMRSGARFNLGYWLNREQTTGIEGTIFFLEPQATSYAAASNGLPILARPFFNTVTNESASLLVAYPGTVRGAFNASVSSTFWGGDVYLRQNLCCNCCGRLDAIAGYRFLGLHENLAIQETEISIGAVRQLPPGSRFDLSDQFNTRNQFHGGQVGLMGEYWRQRLFLQLAGKVALGGTQRSATVNGQTQFGANPALNGGFLALPSNSGHFQDSAFSVVPEANVNVGYQVASWLRAYVGYTFLYWNNVARPGSLVDLSVNSTQLPPGNLTGAARPAFQFHDSDFWAQGVNFGLQARY